MKNFTMAIITIFIIVFLAIISLQAKSTTMADTNRMVEWLVRYAPRHPMSDSIARAEMVSMIDAAADKYRLPRALVVAIVYRESSFIARSVGPAGEIGLMQVHPNTAAKFRCEIKTAANQLNCGCRILSASAERCGTLRGGLTAYGSRDGRCVSLPGSKLSRFVADRFALAQKLIGVSR